MVDFVRNSIMIILTNESHSQLSPGGEREIGRGGGGGGREREQVQKILGCRGFNVLIYIWVGVPDLWAW